MISDVQQHLNAQGLPCVAATRIAFDSSHFTGASFDVSCDTSDPLTPNATESQVLSAVQNIPAVKNAWPVVTLTPQWHNQRGARGAQGHDATSQPLSLLKKRAANGSGDDVFSTHVGTGVSRAHAANITGAGVRIAVVDSGFVTKDVSPLAETQVLYSHDLTDGDADVSDNCSFHGTHVLGIVGASSADRRYGVLGVAPDATFELYRIQKCNTPGAEVDVLVSAFVEAADRGVDVITCSYSGGLDWPNEAWSLVATRIMESGVFVSLPASNDGPGIFTAGSPAGARSVTAVGSAENPETPVYNWQAAWNASGSSGSVGLVPGLPFDFSGEAQDGLSLWLPAVAEDLPDEDCNPVPDNFTSPTDPSRTIMLIDYRHCWTLDGARITAKLGIPYILYYPPKDVDVTLYGLPFIESNAANNVSGAALVSYEDAQNFMSRLKEGDVKIVVPSDPASSDEELTVLPNGLTGNLVSDFSSWGPSLDGRSLPTFIAPGGNILSSFPDYLGGFGVIGGTSMATPFAAGVAALIKQTRPDLKPAQIQAAMALTAKPVRHRNAPSRRTPKGYDFLTPVFAQGGGLVDAWAAAHTTTLVNVSSLSFNDTANRPASLSFEVTNTGADAVEYELNHIGAASGYILNATDRYKFTGSDPEAGEVEAVFAGLEITPKSLTLAPGASAVVSASIASGPDLADAKTRGSYFGGYIAFNTTGPDAPQLSLPYTGFGSPLADLPAINQDKKSTYLAAVNNTGAKPIESGRQFVCSYNASSDSPCSFEADNYYPGFVLTFMLQPYRWAVDVIRSADKKVIVPEILAGGALGVNGTTNPWGPGANYAWDGSEGNGTFLVEGSYSFRVKALKLNGQVDVEEDYDVVELGEWALRYANDSIGLPARMV